MHTEHPYTWLQSQHIIIINSYSILLPMVRLLCPKMKLSKISYKRLHGHVSVMLCWQKRVEDPIVSECDHRDHFFLCYHKVKIQRKFYCAHFWKKNGPYVEIRESKVGESLKLLSMRWSGELNGQELCWDVDDDGMDDFKQLFPRVCWLGNFNVLSSPLFTWMSSLCI